MSKSKRPRKPRVKKVVLDPGQVVDIEVPEGRTSVAAPVPEEKRVESVPAKNKQRWWERFLFGDE